MLEVRDFTCRTLQKAVASGSLIYDENNSGESTYLTPGWVILNDRPEVLIQEKRKYMPTKSHVQEY